jgi:hypothetical protein
MLAIMSRADSDFFATTFAGRVRLPQRILPVCVFAGASATTTHLLKHSQPHFCPDHLHQLLCIFTPCVPRPYVVVVSCVILSTVGNRVYT